MLSRFPGRGAGGSLPFGSGRWICQRLHGKPGSGSYRSLSPVRRVSRLANAVSLAPPPKPSGLGAFGLLVHDLREAAKVESPGQERVWVEEQVKKVSQLDWSNNSPIFKGTLVKGGRAQGSSTAISHAAVVLEVKLNQS